MLDEKTFKRVAIAFASDMERQAARSAPDSEDPTSLSRRAVASLKQRMDENHADTANFADGVATVLSVLARARAEEESRPVSEFGQTMQTMGDAFAAALLKMREG